MIGQRAGKANLGTKNLYGGSFEGKKLLSRRAIGKAREVHAGHRATAAGAEPAAGRWERRVKNQQMPCSRPLVGAVDES